MAIRAEDIDFVRDRTLVERYQAGDPRAFDDLYERYFDRLRSFCQRRVGSRHEAEELAQEAFARALKALPTFAGERRFYPWMTVIASRLCADHHRRAARLQLRDEVDTGPVEGAHDAALIRGEDLDALDAALQRLAPRHRQVLDLREHAGLSYADIAGRLDVPQTTVEALLHRARKALRREFSAVTGHGHLAGVPLIGGLSRALQSLRERTADRLPELSQIATPVAAGAMAMAFTVVAVPDAPAPPPPATVVEAVAPVAAPDPVVPAPAADPQPPAPVAVASPPPPPPPPAPRAEEAPPLLEAEVGPARAGLGADDDGEVDRMPHRSDIGPARVGADPLTVLGDTLANLTRPLGGTQ